VAVCPEPDLPVDDAAQAALLEGKAALDPLGKSAELSNWTLSSGCACGWTGVFCSGGNIYL
jgi:hypothetical protein